MWHALPEVVPVLTSSSRTRDLRCLQALPTPQPHIMGPSGRRASHRAGAGGLRRQRVRSLGAPVPGGPAAVHGRGGVAHSHPKAGGLV